MKQTVTSLRDVDTCENPETIILKNQIARACMGAPLRKRNAGAAPPVLHPPCSDGVRFYTVTLLRCG